VTPSKNKDDTQQGVSPYRFTVAQYHKMKEVGILKEDNQHELVDGRILKITPLELEHDEKHEHISNYLKKTFQDQILWQHLPIQLDEYSEPQPDFVLLKPREIPYEEQAPNVEDIRLIIEIAQKLYPIDSYPIDSVNKQDVYAQCTIPEYWIVRIEYNTLEVYHDPKPYGYKQRTIYTPEEQISPILFPNIQIFVKDLIGE